jgi:hypothetical protein
VQSGRRQDATRLVHQAEEEETLMAKRLGRSIIIRDDLIAAEARAYRTCRTQVDEECRAACHAGVEAVGREIQKLLPRPKPELSRARIVREK